MIVATEGGFFTRYPHTSEWRRLRTGVQSQSSECYKIIIKEDTYSLFMQGRLTATFLQSSLSTTLAPISVLPTSLDKFGPPIHLFEGLEDPHLDKDTNRIFYWRTEQERRGVLEMIDVDIHKKTKIWEFDVLSGHHVNYGIQGNLLAVTYGSTLVLWHCGQEQWLREISLREFQAQGELIAIDGTTLYLFGYKRDALRRVKGQIQKQYVMRTLTFTDQPSLG